VTAGTRIPAAASNPAVHGSLSKRQQPYPWAVAISVALHLALFGGAVIAARYASGPRIDLGQKPIAAKLVRLGKPRDERLLPRKETAPPPPPAPNEAPVPVPPSPPPSTNAAPSAVPAPPAPKAASPATGKAPDAKNKLDDVMKRFKSGLPPGPATASDPVGQPDGDPEGDAEEAAEGERYLALIQRRIKDRYQVPATIPETERLHLNAVVRIYIERNGGIARSELVRSSGNGVYDSAVQAGVGRASPLPPPPEHLVAMLRDGVDLNFRP
jgi:TonB family protein